MQFVAFKSGVFLEVYSDAGTTGAERRVAAPPSHRCPRRQVFYWRRSLLDVRGKAVQASTLVLKAPGFKSST